MPIFSPASDTSQRKTELGGNSRSLNIPKPPLPTSLVDPSSHTIASSPGDLIGRSNPARIWTIHGTRAEYLFSFMATSIRGDRNVLAW
jgi:hypothetical protein